jgi:hypothetical protein
VLLNLGKWYLLRELTTTGTQELEGHVTAGTEVLAPERGRPEPVQPGKVRVPADIPGDVARRLKIWAAMRGMVPGHVVAELVVQAVPDDATLADLMRAGGSGGRDDV